MTLAAVIQPLQQEVHDAMAGPGGGCRGTSAAFWSQRWYAHVLSAADSRPTPAGGGAPLGQTTLGRGTGGGSPPCRRTPDLVPNAGWLASSSGCGRTRVALPQSGSHGSQFWEPPQSGSNDSTRLSQGVRAGERLPVRLRSTLLNCFTPKRPLVRTQYRPCFPSSETCSDEEQASLALSQHRKGHGGLSDFSWRDGAG